MSRGVTVAVNRSSVIGCSSEAAALGLSSPTASFSVRVRKSRPSSHCAACVQNGSTLSTSRRARSSSLALSAVTVASSRLTSCSGGGSARPASALEPFQPRRCDLADKAIDDNARQVGLALDVTADLGQGGWHVRVGGLDATALPLDGLRDGRTPVGR